MTHVQLVPAAERWPGLIFRSRDWRGIVEKVTTGDHPADLETVVVWQCKHRHRTETDAEKCAARANVAQPRKQSREPRERRTESIWSLLTKGPR